MSVTSRVVKNARARGVIVLSRSAWGSSSALRVDGRNVYAWRRDHKPHGRIPHRPADTLWQHITVTRDTGDLRGDFKRDMRTVERIGWERFHSGFSYSFGIDPKTGMVGVGMPLDAKGTHTVNTKRVPGFSYDQNAVSLALAWVGMPGMRPSDRAVLAAGRLVAALIDEGALTLGHDYEPHSLVAWKDCPTDAGRAVMPEINRLGRKLA